MIVKNCTREVNTVKFDVELTPEEFEKYVNGAYLKNRSRIQVSGFRKGKAPRKIIEGLYGADVFYNDAIDDAANDAYGFGVQEEALKTVGRPAMADAQVTDEKGAVLSFQTDVYPVVTLGEYKGLKAVKADSTVTDEEVAADIEKTRKQNGRLITVERPAADGDTVNIDYLGTLDGEAFKGGTAENQNLVLGSNSFVPGFESQIVGMNAGEEKDIDITFPENYTAELAGKAVVFHVKCNEVKEEELPELDDEFAKDNDFDTLEDMKKSVYDRLLADKEKAAQSDFQSALVDIAMDNMQADIPVSMVEEKMDAMLSEYRTYMSNQGVRLEDYVNMTGTNLDSFRESTRSSAESEVRMEVLFDAIAAEEGIEVTEEEVAEELEKMAESYNVKVATLEKLIDKASLKSDILRRKAMEFISANGIAEAAEEAAE